ncbi:MAG: TatD family hydrolase [Clostridia bacterium]|jgi:hypothetical protein
MVIDFHVHCFPDELAEKAVLSLSECSDIPARVNGTIKDIKKSMKEAGVSKSVVLSIATKPSQTKKINIWSSKIADDEIVPFGTLHPHNTDWKNELAAISATGLKGIKFHPDYQNFFVDDKEMFAIYEKAFELGLIIVFHAGLDIGLPAPYHCTPDGLAEVVKAFPGAKIVAAHMGGFSFWDDVEKFLVGQEIYLDTSYCLDYMKEEQLRRIIDNHGYEKILFATDSPWCDQKEEIEKIRLLNFKPEIKEAILAGNALKLLGLK